VYLYFHSIKRIVEQNIDQRVLRQNSSDMKPKTGYDSSDSEEEHDFDKKNVQTKAQTPNQAKAPSQQSPSLTTVVKDTVLVVDKNSHKFTSKILRDRDIQCGTTTATCCEVEVFPQLTLDETVLNLQNIFGLNAHQKCHIRDNIIQVDSYYYLQPIMRWWSSDNRSEIVDFIVHIFEQANRHIKELIVCIKKSEASKRNTVEDRVNSMTESVLFRETLIDEYHRKLQGLISDMENGAKGLLNLIITYKGDLTIENKLHQQFKSTTEYIDSTRRLLRSPAN